MKPISFQISGNVKSLQYTHVLHDHLYTMIPHVLREEPVSRVGTQFVVECGSTKVSVSEVITLIHNDARVALYRLEKAEMVLSLHKDTSEVLPVDVFNLGSATNQKVLPHVRKAVQLYNTKMAIWLPGIMQARRKQA